MKAVKETNVPRCSKCGYTEIRYRSKSDTFLCRHCGHVWPKEE